MSANHQGWNGTPVSITTPWGDMLTVLAEDASHYGDVLETGVSWAYETRYLAPYVRSGDVVVDVGANYGYTTCYFASVCGPSGHVLALEPEPDTRALLEHNVRQSGYQNVEIVPCRRGCHERVDLVVAQRNQLRQPCSERRTRAQHPGLGSGRRRHRRRPLRGAAR